MKAFSACIDGNAEDVWHLADTVRCQSLFFACICPSPHEVVVLSVDKYDVLLTGHEYYSANSTGPVIGVLKKLFHRSSGSAFPEGKMVRSERKRTSVPARPFPNIVGCC